MDILIKNCNLISMSNGRPEYEENMSIYIENDRITEIDQEVIPNRGAHIIDAKGKICMPGFVNAHAHLSMSIFRETLDGYGLQEWLNEKIWPMEDKLVPQDVYVASMLSCLEMISTGTTTANDMYFMTEDTIRAALEAGVRLQVTRTVNDVAGLGKERMEELEELVRCYKDRYDLITLNVGIHGLYTTGAETVQKMVELAKENDLRIHMHFCENEQEVRDIKREYNVREPVDVLKKYFKATQNILAHVVKVSNEEITELARMRANVVHCPISNLKLGCRSCKSSKNVR